MDVLTTFYALYSVEPLGFYYRYIGFTRRHPDVRFKEHLDDRSDTKKVKWLQDCIAKEIPVRLEVLRLIPELSDDDTIRIEQELIEEYGGYGELVNSSKGGEGVRRHKLLPNEDRECLVCKTMFLGSKLYCGPDCTTYIKKVSAIPRPEPRTLLWGKHCQWNCTCPFCTKVANTVTNQPYVNPRNLNLFSRERIPLLDDKL